MLLACDSKSRRASPMAREISAAVEYCVTTSGEGTLAASAILKMEGQVRVCPGREPWAVILAGGDGIRLRPLSKLISGDDRPKQFCPLFGDKSLLAHTRNRLSGTFGTDRTLFVVTKTHERWYTEELRDVHPDQIAAQPLNRGTGAGIAFALLRILDLDRDADPVVAFFPADHFYANEQRFRESVDEAMKTASSDPASIVLLGAEATH